MSQSKGTTKAETYKILKKEAARDAEIVEAMGQESEKQSKKWVQEVHKEKEAIEQKHQDTAMSILTDARNKIFTYKDALLKEMRREMDNWVDDLPTGYTWHASYTSKGLVMWLKNKNNEYFAKGLKLSGEPKYDLNGVARLIVGAIEEANNQEKPEKTDSIIFPYK